ncbi:MAG: hypothetical protein Q9197_001278 [Variospora fuerteventurae]
MPTLPWYNEILNRLIKRDSSILDIGCCFGQDLRFLAADGAPTAKMYATDIVSDFWELSYDLFRDKDSFRAEFITADVLNPASPLTVLKGEVDIFLVNQVFHLFDKERQIQVAKNIIALSSKDSWVVGWQVGSVDGVALPVRTQTGGSSGSAGSQTKQFHNKETWEAMWQRAGEETNTQWSVETHMEPLEQWGYEKEDTAWMGPGATGLEFICRRMASSKL